MALVERQLQEDILARDSARDGRIVLPGLAGLGRLAALLVSLLTVLGSVAGGLLGLLLAGHDFNLQRARRDILLVDFGRGRRNGESAGAAGLEQVGDGLLARGGAFAVDDVDARHGAFLRSPYYVEIVGAGPVEIAHPRVGGKNDAEGLVGGNHPRAFQFQRLGCT